MTDYAFTSSAGNGRRSLGFHKIFKPRDIFLHDGRNLRRLSVSAKLQMVVAALIMAMLGWLAFASVHIASETSAKVAESVRMQRKVAAMQADVEAMKRETAARAALLERRQAFLAALLSGQDDPAKLAAMVPGADAPYGAAGGEVAARFSAIDDQQIYFVEQAASTAEERYHTTAKEVRKLGINPKRFLRGGVGGPFEAVSAPATADPKFKALFESWKKLDQLEQGVIAIPSARPVSNINATSGFGVRSDPFRRRAAMHAGIDLAGPVGTPIYATADGIVGRSQYAGGYGNLVEINHGKGIQTRYGHLSKRLVQPGQRVRRGQLIGRMGSTGRSTGSHLHYEVRLDGKAVNPVPFMQTNDYLLAVQRRAAATQVAALGGPDD
ncbi:MAG: M23 family metallopeptidase [Sphingomonadaceae bacterium]